jgi:TRAP-type C4-dicarboxylate transport system permease small subunit
MLDRIMAVYRKLVRGICKFLEVIAALSLVAMLFIVLYNIIMRYFFANSPRWAEELARQCVVIFCFISIALGVRDKIHISLSIIADTLFKKFLLPLEIFNKFLVLALGIMMSVFMGPYFTMLRYNRLPGSGIPVGYIYVFPTAVGVLISLISLYQIYEHFKYGTDETQKNQAAQAGQKEGK